MILSSIFSVTLYFNMNRVRVLIGWVLIFILLPTAVLYAEPSPQRLMAFEILQRSDKVRNPDTPFATQITLIEYNKAKKVDTLILNVHSKRQKKNGQYRSLVAFIKPQRDAGKKMLQNGNEIWFYDPAAKNSIRMSAQQRLMGQASNGDVMTSNFSLDYQVELLGEEAIKDTTKKSRMAYRLYMTAKTSDVTYAFVDLWVEKNSFHPVKAKFYSSSKRLMKIAYYSNFQEQLGRVRPTKMLIIDGVNTHKVTLMQMSNYRAVNIPDAWFQRSYLPRF